MYGGGVFCAIKTELNPRDKKILVSNCEGVWGSVKFAKTQALYWGSYYRPPTANPEQLDKLSTEQHDSLSDIYKHTNKVPNIS